MKWYTYQSCSEKEIPGRVRFDVIERRSGQIIEVAYGGFNQAEHDEGDLCNRPREERRPRP